MALSDLYSNLNILLRWLHVIAAITWLGHLYFFNFVNVPLQAALDDAGKKAVNAKLLPRALWWFRWAAMITFLAGLLLFTMNYMYAPGTGFGPTPLFQDAQGVTARAGWIMFGMFFATIMWISVWFIVWPAQKKMLGGKATAEELPVLRRRSFLVSRANAYFSGPMLFGMLAPSHYGAINALTVLIAIAVGVLAIWWAAKASSSVGTSV
jgi:uncharacterized membrane protein